VTGNSKELPSDLLTGHASSPYIKHGKHLNLIKLSTTSSEAERAILPYTALNDLLKDFFALSKQQRKYLARVINTPKYLKVSTHSRQVPSQVICFVMTKYKKFYENRLRKMVTGFYTLEEVSAAKHQLLDDVERRKILVPVPLYRTNTEIDLQLDDVLDLLGLLEVNATSGTKCLPIYVADSSEKVPTSQLADGDLAILLTKFDKMAAVVETLQNTVHSLLSSSVACSSRPCTTTTTTGMQTEPASTVTDNTRHGAPGPSRLSLARQPPKPGVCLLPAKQRHDLQLPLEKPAAENRLPTSMDDSETDDGYEKRLSRKAKRRRFSSQQQQRETADGNERSSQPAVAMRNPQRRRPSKAAPCTTTRCWNVHEKN